MMCHRYEIDSTVLKTTEKMILWKAELGFVEVEKDSLAARVMLDEKVKGYVFQGKARLALDTIVETDNGAVGKTTEKDLTEPFLMLTETEQVNAHLTPATDEDLVNRNHKSPKDFIEYIEDVFHRFLRRQMHGYHRSRSDGCIFAFANQEGRPDLLVADRDRTVFESRSLMYVSDGHGVIMRGPHVGTVVKRGRCLIAQGCH